MAYSKDTGNRIANTATPRLPKWIGHPQEYVIVVSIGEPRRSHAEMRRVVEAQIAAYCERFEPPERQLDSGFTYAMADDLTRRYYDEDQGGGIRIQRPLFEHHLDQVLLAKLKHERFSADLMEELRTGEAGAPKTIGGGS
jgi:hypothetical protein